MQWWQQPFFQVALPIIVTIILCNWCLAARISDLGNSLRKHIDELRNDMNEGEALQERSWR